MSSVIMGFLLTGKCGQFSNNPVNVLTEEKRMKYNSSFNNNHTQIKVPEILFQKFK